MEASAGRLETLSPLSVLRRGYSITTRADSDELLTNAGAVNPGDRLRTRLAKGEIVSTVEARNS